MCGRYAASASLDELVEEFAIELDASAGPSRSILVNPQSPPPGSPDWNMAPTKQAPVVLTRAVAGQPVRQLRLLTWGLVPSWSKDPKGGVRMINARAETIATKPAYARALAARRALVPAQGWYEWQVSPTATDAKGKPRKQPFFIHRGDGDVVAMAGIYEFWRDREIADADDPAAWLTTFAVLTTHAEPGLDRIHDGSPSSWSGSTGSGGSTRTWSRPRRSPTCSIRSPAGASPHTRSRARSAPTGPMVHTCSIRAERRPRWGRRSGHRGDHHGAP
jgi:putative SOS response-associated peptidase YedK